MSAELPHGPRATCLSGTLIKTILLEGEAWFKLDATLSVINIHSYLSINFRVCISFNYFGRVCQRSRRFFLKVFSVCGSFGQKACGSSGIEAEVSVSAFFFLFFSGWKSDINISLRARLPQTKGKPSLQATSTCSHPSPVPSTPRYLTV